MITAAAIPEYKQCYQFIIIIRVMNLRHKYINDVIHICGFYALSHVIFRLFKFD